MNVIEQHLLCGFSYVMSQLLRSLFVCLSSCAEDVAIVLLACFGSFGGPSLPTYAMAIACMTTIIDYASYVSFFFFLFFCETMLLMFHCKFSRFLPFVYFDVFGTNVASFVGAIVGPIPLIWHGSTLAFVRRNQFLDAVGTVKKCLCQ